MAREAKKLANELNNIKVLKIWIFQELAFCLKGVQYDESRKLTQIAAYYLSPEVKDGNITPLG